MSAALDRGRSRLTILICFLVAIFEGIDLQAAGVAAPQLIPHFGLSAAQTGAFFSASTLGLLIGAPISGWLADQFGRKWMVELHCAAVVEQVQTEPAMANPIMPVETTS